jgi:hypothetical protein
MDGMLLPNSMANWLQISHLLSWSPVDIHRIRNTPWKMQLALTCSGQAWAAIQACDWRMAALDLAFNWVEAAFHMSRNVQNPGAQSSRPWNVLPMQESAREHEYINMLQHVTTSSREEASSIFLPAPSSSRGIFPCCWGIGGENHGRAPKDFSESVAKPKALGFTNQKVCPNVLYIPQNSRSSLNRWLSKSHLVTWLGTCQTSMGQKVPYP